MPDITQDKEDIFAKVVKSIFSIDDIESKNINKNNNSIGKYKFKKKQSNNTLIQPKNNLGGINKEKISKRSSLCPGIKFQNKNKHVTFGQRNGEKMDDTFNKQNIDENMINEDNENNIKRIKLYDKND